jgi:hypothetical protein
MGNFMRNLFLRLVTASSIILLSSPWAEGGIITRFENFDSDPGWTSVGNGVNGNDFGYRTSSFAGGSAGEAGGHFTRSMLQRAYGDSDLGGGLSLDDALTASGKFGFTDANRPDFGTFLEVGYYQQVQSASLMGINVGNGQGGPLRLFGLLQLSDGTYVSTAEVTPVAGVPLAWAIDWNPLGGAFGAGRYSVTIDGNTAFVDLTLAQRAVGASFNSFGLNGFNNYSSSDSSEYANFFVDDLNYNAIAAVPEPASLCIWGGIGIFGLVGCWRRKRMQAMTRSFTSARRSSNSKRSQFCENFSFCNRASRHGVGRTVPRGINPA